MNNRPEIDQVIDALKKFKPVSLSEMDSVELLNRFDAKYMTSVQQLPGILTEVSNEYRVLAFNGVSYIHYDNVYFDTDQLKFYFDHHNERAVRQKVRIRKYSETNACFFELKLKDNKGRTNKLRLNASDIKENLSDAEKDLLYSSIPKLDGKPVYPQLYNQFNRITLVNFERGERATIDTNISFKFNGIIKEFPDLVIIEIKQDFLARGISGLRMAMRKRKNVGTSISKYCLGNIYTHPKLKHNNFKNQIITLKKLDDASFTFTTNS